MRVTGWSVLDCKVFPSINKLTCLLTLYYHLHVLKTRNGTANFWTVLVIFGHCTANFWRVNELVQNGEWHPCPNILEGRYFLQEVLARVNWDTVPKNKCDAYVGVTKMAALWHSRPKSPQVTLSRRKDNKSLKFWEKRMPQRNKELWCKTITPTITTKSN